MEGVGGRDAMGMKMEMGENEDGDRDGDDNVDVGEVGDRMEMGMGKEMKREIRMEMQAERVMGIGLWMRTERQRWG